MLHKIFGRRGISIERKPQEGLSTQEHLKNFDCVRDHIRNEGPIEIRG
jgi:hypothetical protein